MADARTLAWIAVRVTTHRRSGAALAVVLAVGTICITIVVLATLAVPGISAQQERRTEAITPRIDQHGSATDSSKLRMIDPSLSDSRRWNGHRVIREYFVRGTSPMVAPGVQRMPAAGEYFASPALASLMRTDSTIAALFSGRRMLGLIDERGVTQPHELRAVEGVPSDVPLLVNVTGFGGPDRGIATSVEDNAVLNRVVALFVAAVVWLPGVAFVVIITRLASRQRRQRARALRLVGLSRSVTLLIHALETTLVCLPAAAIGCLVFARLTERFSRIPGTELGYFSVDAKLNPTTYAAVAVVVAALAALSTASAVKRVVDDPEQARVIASPQPSRLGVALLVAGVVLLVLMPALVWIFGPIMAIGLWLGCGLVAAGAGLAGPTVVSRLSRRAAQKVRSGATLVGLRLAGTGLTSLKLGSMLSVIIILLLGTLSFMNVLNGGNAQDWDARLARQRQAPVVVNDLTGRLALRTVDEISPSGGAMQMRPLRSSGHDIPTIFGDCSDLEHLAGAAPQKCRDEPQWIAPSETGSLKRVPKGALNVPGVGAIQFPSIDNQLYARNLPEQFYGALLLPAQMAPAKPTANGSYFFLVVRNVDLRTTLARISATAPAVQFDLGELDRHNPDTQRFPTQLQWLTVGACAGLLLGILALTGAALGEASERRSQMRGLRILGARHSQLLTAHLWATAAPPVLLGWMATFIGWLVCRAMQNVDDRAFIDHGALIRVALGALLVGLIVGAVTWPDAHRASDTNAGISA